VRAVVLLDRDGVINERVRGYVTRWDEFRFAPGALEGLRVLAGIGARVAVVTNQSAIGRGVVDAARVEAIHSRMSREVRRAGGRIDDVLVCPHSPSDLCDCRKPAPGLLVEALRRLDAGGCRPYVVGDSWSDGAAGALVGARTVLVDRDADAGSRRGAFVDAVVRDLREAAAWIASDVADAAGTKRPASPSARPCETAGGRASSRHLDGVSELLRRVPRGSVDRMADLLARTAGSGGTIFCLGNGGSAATASHFVSDLAKGTERGTPPRITARALCDNVPLLTAWSNDVEFEEAFARQLAGAVLPGDAVLGISVSGSSRNVLRALWRARAAGAATAALTGFDGGAARTVADVCVVVPSEDYRMVEDCHLAVLHCIAAQVQERLERTRPPDERSFTRWRDGRG